MKKIHYWFKATLRLLSHVRGHQSPFATSCPISTSQIAYQLFYPPLPTLCSFCFWCLSLILPKKINFLAPLKNLEMYLRNHMLIDITRSITIGFQLFQQSGIVGCGTFVNRIRILGSRVYGLSRVQHFESTI